MYGCLHRGKSNNVWLVSRRKTVFFNTTTGRQSSHCSKYPTVLYVYTVHAKTLCTPQTKARLNSVSTVLSYYREWHLVTWYPTDRQFTVFLHVSIQPLLCNALVQYMSMHTLLVWYDIQTIKLL